MIQCLWALYDGVMIFLRQEYPYYMPWNILGCFHALKRARSNKGGASVFFFWDNTSSPRWKVWWFCSLFFLKWRQMEKKHPSVGWGISIFPKGEQVNNLSVPGTSQDILVFWTIEWYPPTPMVTHLQVPSPWATSMHIFHSSPSIAGDSSKQTFNSLLEN